LTPLSIDWSKLPLGRKPDKLIADELGISPGSVWRARQRLGIVPSIPALTEEEIIEILTLRRQGWKYRRIADEIGCSVSSVGYICTGQRQKQLVAKHRTGECLSQQE